MENRKAFNFYRSYYDVAMQLEGNDRLQFLTALLQKQFENKEPELTGLSHFAYISQKHSIDSQVEGFISKTKKTPTEPPYLPPSVPPTQPPSYVAGNITMTTEPPSVPPTEPPSVQEKEQGKEQGKEKEKVKEYTSTDSSTEILDFTTKPKGELNKMLDEILSSPFTSI